VELGDAWGPCKAEIERTLSSDPRWSTDDHHLCEVHTLDRLDEITAVSRPKDNTVTESLLAHLVRNWATQVSSDGHPPSAFWH
jgi:hypothetical protein